MADSGTQPAGAPALPQFENKKIYLVKGETLNNMVNRINFYRPRATTGGGLKIDSQSDQGTFFSAVSTIQLTVCVNGVPVTKTFLLAAP